jgi:hypothetical protein
MGRKASRKAVTDVTDAMQTVTDTVAKSGRRARKKAAALAARASGQTPKPRRRKRKVAVLVVILAGAGFAAKKTMAARSGAGNGAAS